MKNNRTSWMLAMAAASALTLTGCVPNVAEGSGASALTVDSSANDCDVSSGEAPSGPITFSVTNSSDQVTEFYLLADDGLRIVGEVENVAPGVKRDLVVQAKPGSYFTVCKPGMVGAGVGKAPFTVTDSGAEISLPGDQREQAEAAAVNYAAYVRDQVGQLVPATDEFLNAYLAGDVDAARSMYATTRAHYERIEPVAESFGDLDPKLDFREADVAEGDEWSGWHRIEKDLWPPAVYTPLTPTERAYFAEKLTADTEQLYDLVTDKDFSMSIDAISNGAIGLMDEVASGKITGEEEIWSHTDLWDFQANLEGARVAYEGVRDIVQAKNPALVKKIDSALSALESELAEYGSLGDGFVPYDELTTKQVKELSDRVNTLAEPLSHLTAALVG